MKKRCLILTCFMSSLFAEKPWKLEIDVAAGYRQDKETLIIHETPTPTLAEPIRFNREIYKAKYKHMRGPELQGKIQGEFYHIILRFWGNYTWWSAGRYEGKSTTPFPPGDPRQSIARFHSSIRGGAFDILGLGGYEFFLYDNSGYQFSLTPFGGYVLYNQKIRHKSVRPNPYVIPVDELSPGLTFLSSAVKQSKLTKNWWGPAVGGEIKTLLANRYRIEAGYLYQWLDFKIDQVLPLHSIIAAGPVSGFIDTKYNLKYKVKNASANRGWIRFLYQIDQNWEIGGFGVLQYAKIKKNSSVTTIIDNVSNLPTPPKVVQKDKVSDKWCTFSVLLEAGYSY